MRIFAKRFLIILPALVFLAAAAVTLTCFTPEIIKGSLTSGMKLAIGPSAEDKRIHEVDASSRSELSVKVLNGDIKIIRGSKDSIRIIERRKLKGPAPADRLEKMLQDFRSNVNLTSVGININLVPGKELAPLYGITDDIELVVPATIKSVRISTEIGDISISGFEDASTIDLSTGKGLVHIKRCSATNLYVRVNEGEIGVSGFEGSGLYECARGNIHLSDISGEIELKSASGSSKIENADGRLDCDISSGELAIVNSRIKSGANLYASHGNIAVDMQDIENAGKYYIKAAAGDITLKVPCNTGYSLIARSTRGRIHNRFDPDYKLLQKAPSGEVYGDVGGGGARIDVYTDMGDIFLE